MSAYQLLPIILFINIVCIQVVATWSGTGGHFKQVVGIKVGVCNEAGLDRV
jgi:hypothetical protein